MKSKNCYRCAHCKHNERLFTNTIFQDNKLPLNVFLYGLFLIFTSKKGISSLELSEELKKRKNINEELEFKEVSGFES